MSAGILTNQKVGTRAPTARDMKARCKRAENSQSISRVLTSLAKRSPGLATLSPRAAILSPTLASSLHQSECGCFPFVDRPSRSYSTWSVPTLSSARDRPPDLLEATGLLEHELPAEPTLPLADCETGFE